MQFRAKKRRRKTAPGYVRPDAVQAVPDTAHAEGRPCRITLCSLLMHVSAVTWIKELTSGAAAPDLPLRDAGAGRTPCC